MPMAARGLARGSGSQDHERVQSVVILPIDVADGKRLAKANPVVETSSRDPLLTRRGLGFGEAASFSFSSG